MNGMSSSSGFDSASYSQNYSKGLEKMGGRRKKCSTRRKRERGGQRFSSRAGGKKWGGKRYTKKRGGRNKRTKK
jgi:hypothetical protein